MLLALNTMPVGFVIIIGYRGYIDQAELIDIKSGCNYFQATSKNKNLDKHKPFELEVVHPALISLAKYLLLDF